MINYETLNDLPEFTDTNERSLIWSGTSVGHARYLVEDWIFGQWLQLMGGYARVLQYGVLDTNHASYSGHLATSNPAGVTLRLASGAAFVLYNLYLNDANIDFALTNPGYYRLVLSRKPAFYASNPQTVRATLKGPQSQGWPLVIRGTGSRGSESQFELPIARAHSTGAAIDQLIDDRRFFRNLTIPFRRGLGGGSYSWGNASGTAIVPTLGAHAQGGVVRPDEGVVEWPYSYGSIVGDDPVVFFQATMDIADAVPTSTKTIPNMSRNLDALYNNSVGDDFLGLLYLVIGPKYSAV